MRLLDLDPRWILREGKRIGFTFRSPAHADYRQACFVVKTPMRVQLALFEDMHGEDAVVQPCKQDFAWTVNGGIDAADFATITVTPSLDGSKGGLWHGHITGGRIVGGL